MSYTKILSIFLLTLSLSINLKAQQDTVVQDKIKISLMLSWTPKQISKTPPIIIINNKDTADVAPSGNYFTYSYDPPFDIYKKASIRVELAHFPDLILDSVSIARDLYINILDSNEHFYVVNGVKKPLLCQVQIFSIELKGGLDSIQQEFIVNGFCNRYDLEYASNFRIILNSPTYNTKMYGGLDDVLKRTYWLAKKNDDEIKIDESYFNEIRSNPQVSFIGIPLDYSQTIVNGILVEFKKGVDSLAIKELIKGYGMEKHKYYDYQLLNEGMHYFTVSTIIPSNQLLIDLMKDYRIIQAYPMMKVYNTF